MARFRGNDLQLFAGQVVEWNEPQSSPNGAKPQLGLLKKLATAKDLRETVKRGKLRRLTIILSNGGPA